MFLLQGTEIEDPNTGCRGCSSGDGGNIFGNKYGQYLAAIQVAREEKAAFEAQDINDNDDEGFCQEIIPRNQARKIAPTLELGPVGAADGGTGDLDSVWAEDDEEVGGGDAKAGAKRLVGKGAKGMTNESNLIAGPPGKRSKPN